MVGKYKSGLEASPREVARLRSENNSWDEPPRKYGVFACMVERRENKSGFSGRSVETPLGVKKIRGVSINRVFFEDGSEGYFGSRQRRATPGWVYSLFVYSPEHIRPELGMVHAGFLQPQSSIDSLVGQKVCMKLPRVFPAEVEKIVTEVKLKSAVAGKRIIRLMFNDKTFAHAFELPDGRFTLFARPAKSK